MAFVDQPRKARIAAALKPVMPKGWKYSLAVRNYSTLVLTISAAPVNLVKAIKPSKYFNPETETHADVNPYHYANHLQPEYVETFKKIFQAINCENHDNSDLMTDYFDVGYYVDVQIGRWDKPFTTLQ